MYNQILWTLDNGVSGEDFERLCTDLLGREDYKEIVPIGGVHDRGRDAEIRLYRGVRSGGITFFQYSLEDRWESKLIRELEKVYKNKHAIETYVFVTSQRVTGEKRDKLTEMVDDKYKWRLIIYDREWFRHRLEDVHHDLAAKYLGITTNPSPNKSVNPEKPYPFSDKTGEKVWAMYLNGDYDAAAVEFKRLLQKNESDIKAWQALSWCQYSLFRYSEALVSINKALSQNESNEFSLSLKASILTEVGIQRGIKANLLLARDIFKIIAGKSKRWVDHYNYGNVLHALGNYDGAKTEFKTALTYDRNQPLVWKNLGTVYYHIHDHKEELKCYDEALKLNNQLPEALASKGVTLFIVFGNAKEAIKLITNALEIDKEMGLHWPQGWYWLGKAYIKIGKYEKALNQVNTGLEYVPHHSGLLDLKAEILSKLWKRLTQYTEYAIAFYEFRTELSEHDFTSLAELVRLYIKTGKEKQASQLLNTYTSLRNADTLSILETIGQNLDGFLASLEYFSAYKKFREMSKLADYEIALKDQKIRSDDVFMETLYIACFTTFGNACKYLSSLQLDERYGAMNKIYPMMQKSIGNSLPLIAKLLLQNVQFDTVELSVAGISRIMTTFPMIALFELSRQAGFVGAIFGIPAENLDTAIQKVDLGKWQGRIAGDIFLELNKVLKIIKE